jgi:hypothetical protein
MRQGDEEYLEGTKNTSSVVRNTSIDTSNLDPVDVFVDVIDDLLHL